MHECDYPCLCSFDCNRMPSYASMCLHMLSCCFMYVCVFSCASMTLCSSAFYPVLLKVAAYRFLKLRRTLIYLIRMLFKKQHHSDSSKITFTQHLYQTAFPHCHHGLRKSKTHPTEDNRASLHADLLSHSTHSRIRTQSTMPTYNRNLTYMNTHNICIMCINCKYII